VPAFTESVELPPAVIDVGLSDAVAPVGVPDTLSVMDCALPLVTAVEIVLLPPAPWASVRLEGLAEIEKSLGGGGAVTVRVTLALCVADVPVPVTVSV
jgi:hypothetical protein